MVPGLLDAGSAGWLCPPHVVGDLISAMSTFTHPFSRAPTPQVPARERGRRSDCGTRVGFRWPARESPQRVPFARAYSALVRQAREPSASGLGSRYWTGVAPQPRDRPSPRAGPAHRILSARRMGSTSVAATILGSVSPGGPQGCAPSALEMLGGRGARSERLGPQCRGVWPSTRRFGPAGALTLREASGIRCSRDVPHHLGPE